MGTSKKKQLKKILIHNGNKLKVNELKQILEVNNSELLNLLGKFVSNELNNNIPNNYVYICIEYIIDIISNNHNMISLETFHEMQKIKNILEKKEREIGISKISKKYYHKILELVNPITQILDKKTKKAQAEEDEQNSNTILYKFTSKLINEFKNFDLFCQIVKIYPNIINCTDKKGMPIIYNIIKKQVSCLKKNNNSETTEYYSKVINYIVNCNEFYLSEKHLKHILNYLRTNLCTLEESNDNTQLITFVRDLLDNLKNKNKMHTIPNNVRDICKKYNICELDEDYLIDTIKLKNSKPIIDYTDKLVISMDTSNHVRIFDDAISCEILPNGNYLIGVYIANVASLIPYGSDLDLLSYNRTESIYLNDRVIDMLPQRLSYKCSLNDFGTKKAVAYMFEFTKEAELVNFKIENVIINVERNITFNEGQKILNRSDSKNEHIILLLKNLILFNEKIDEKYFYNINYHKFKEEIRKIENVHEHHGDNLCSHLVETLMILVNNTVAKYFSDKKYPFLYRVNGMPIDEALIENIKSIPDYEKLPMELTQKIDDVYYKSSYSSNNTGHKGLNLDCYCHTTNPIRNYASLFTQRMVIDEFINGGIPDDLLRGYEENITNIANYINLKTDIDYNFKKEYNMVQKKFTRK